jgi:hypothetical protein
MKNYLKRRIPILISFIVHLTAAVAIAFQMRTSWSYIVLFLTTLFAYKTLLAELGKKDTWLFYSIILCYSAYPYFWLISLGKVYLPIMIVMPLVAVASLFLIFLVIQILRGMPKTSE